MLFLFCSTQYRSKSFQSPSYSRFVHFPSWHALATPCRNASLSSRFRSHFFPKHDLPTQRIK